MSILRPALVKSSIGYIETRQMPDDKRQCIIAALEKQLPKEATDDGAFDKCPCCGTEFNSELLNEYDMRYCIKCGQRIEGV